ncbi:MAG: hypothetical protein HUU02_01605 [Bacteroidetes bacterium]|nr:hypothetical protein [Bacteroidota bacterium]
MTGIGRMRTIANGMVRDRRRKVKKDVYIEDLMWYFVVTDCSDGPLFFFPSQEYQ